MTLKFKHLDSVCTEYETTEGAAHVFLAVPLHCNQYDM